MTNSLPSSRLLAAIAKSGIPKLKATSVEISKPCATNPTLIVACVYKPGARFSDEYVYRLRDSVAKNLTKPYQFVCYTDQPLDGTVLTLPLLPDMPGWFNKASLWMTPRPWTCPTLYFDLDTMIVGNIDRIASCERTTMLSDLILFNRGKRSLQSGMMYLTEGALMKLREHFDGASFRKLGGDATYIRMVLPNSPIFQEWVPNQICSWREDWMRGKRHTDTRVICFHGTPRPHEINWDINAHWYGRAYTIRAPGVPPEGSGPL